MIKITELIHPQLVPDVIEPAGFGIEPENLAATAEPSEEGLSIGHGLNQAQVDVTENSSELRHHDPCSDKPE